ncbi:MULTISPECIES: type III secretion system inner rod subunit SctI [unclassified Pseudomonas]|uniref:type III secretion system inner rod subunit SctI n=1 Tax=unclassified Pseudomonas TaxID=196821 RepID=UPI001943BFC4|nr:MULTISPECIES: type III secretion system inner rod subunit SctI [unclassified Pseudomonas]MDC0690356.1 type III secretion system inner rod subunit SctI [Mitsuaria sp. RG]MCE0917193.1 type III secretion system inner rod subunit SctI [Pseudomonas sp. NMI760_13]MCF1490529.1 type III secretion system inner rod subunit SctI [Pseudomonas sp. AA27]MCP8635513.1 type III secretion system inner rod subunit SctI [Pseudomonas sp. DVZ6]MDD7786978.1 type III secretion system inner rod subunit SctI [Pseudo
MNGITEVTRVVTDLQSLSAPAADSRQVAEFEQALSGAADSPGDGLLHQIGQLHQQHTEARQGAQASLVSRTGDPVALMDAHWSLIRSNLQVELIAKGVGRTTQNIETLMKAQ